MNYMLLVQKEAMIHLEAVHYWRIWTSIHTLLLALRVSNI